MRRLTSVNLFTASYGRNLPLSKNSGQPLCSETHTGSHLEVHKTDLPDNMVISHSTIAHSSTGFHDRSRPLTTNSGHCLENGAGSQLEDADTATSSTMVRNSNTQNPSGIIKS